MPRSVRVVLAALLITLLLPAMPGHAAQPGESTPTPPTLASNQLYLTVFHDLDSDGARDPNEPPYLASNLTVEWTNCDTGTVIATTPIDRQGTQHTGWAPSTGQNVRARIIATTGGPYTWTTGAAADGTTPCQYRDWTTPGLAWTVGVANALPPAFEHDGIVWGTTFRDGDGDGINSLPYSGRYEPDMAFTVRPDLIALDVPGYLPGDIVQPGSSLGWGNTVYAFAGVAPGTYQLHLPDHPDNTPVVGVPIGRQRLDHPWGNTFNPASRTTPPFTVGTGPVGSPHAQHLATLSDGYESVSIGGRVWIDTNRDGIQTEWGGVAAIPVELIDCHTNTVIATTTTESDGTYRFNRHHPTFAANGLPPGVYATRFAVDPTRNWTISPRHVDDGQPNPHLRDSNIDPATLTTECITATFGTSTFEDRMWRFDHLDAGLSATSTITGTVWEDLDLTGEPDPAEPALPAVTIDLYTLDHDTDTTSHHATTTTGTDGTYQFPDLEPGDYRLIIAQPLDWWTIPGHHDTGSSIDLPTIPTPDDHQTPGVIDISVSGNGTDLTYNAGALRAGSVADLVWNDLDADGIQDPGEPALPDTTVHLWACTTADDGPIITFDGGTITRPCLPDDLPTFTGTIEAGLAHCPTGSTQESGWELVATELTDEHGNYQFTPLHPAYIYRASFQAHPGYTHSPPDQHPGDHLDSDTDDTGWTGCFHLATNRHITSLDNGQWTNPTGPSTITGHVWRDRNADGTYAVAEPLLPGIPVELHNGDTLVATAITDTAGNYRFEDLAAGTYTIAVTRPDGWRHSPTGTDSHIDPATSTTSVTLPAGTHQVVDAGLFAPDIQIVKTAQVPIALPGQTVTFEIAVTNTGDGPLTNIDIDDPLAPDCDHTIGLILNGATRSFTCEMTAPSASFINTVTGTGWPVCTVLACPPVTDTDDEPQPIHDPSIQIVKTGLTPTVTPGGTVTFEIAVTNTGDVALHQVAVTDRLTDGTPIPECDRTIGTLAVGQTVTYRCKMTAPNTSFINTATGTGTPACPPNLVHLDACQPVDDSSEVPQPVDDPDPNPAIEVTKQNVDAVVLPGTTVAFDITVTNTGDITLHQVAVTDGLTDGTPVPECDRTIGTLAVGQTVTYRCEMTAPNTSFVNTATGTGTPACPPNLVHLDACQPVDDSSEVPQPVHDPSIQIVKTGLTPTVDPGGTAVFEIAVTNTGDVDLHQVAVVDQLTDGTPVPECDRTIGTLAVGQTVTYRCKMTAPNTSFINTATGTGIPACPPDAAHLEACQPVDDSSTVPQDVPEPPPAPPVTPPLSPPGTPPVTPPGPPQAPPVPPSPPLPVTGGEVTGLLLAALALIAIGGSLATIGRRTARS